MPAGDLADAILSSPRTLISLGAKASVAIVEEFTADSSTSHYFSNSVTEIDLAEGAHLTHRCGLMVFANVCMGSLGLLLIALDQQARLELFYLSTSCNSG